MFLLLALAISSVIALFFTLRWALSPPGSPLDGSVRVLAASIAGGVLAFWVLGASIARELTDDARTMGGTPLSERVAALYDVIYTSAPISAELALVVGACLGFFIGMASVGSYKRTA